MSDKSVRRWIEQRLETMDLEGRDDLRTHLITQEIPFWYQATLDGKGVPEDEITWLINRRGFNAEEQKKLRALAAFFNDNGQDIRLMWAKLD